MESYPGELLVGVFPLVFCVDATLEKKAENGRNQFDKFHSGDVREGLKPFVHWCAGLALVRTTERSIEGQMSRIGSVYRRARRASPAYVDVELRFSEFETDLV